MKPRHFPVRFLAAVAMPLAVVLVACSSTARSVASGSSGAVSCPNSARARQPVRTIQLSTGRAAKETVKVGQAFRVVNPHPPTAFRISAPSTNSDLICMVPAERSASRVFFALHPGVATVRSRTVIPKGAGDAAGYIYLLKIRVVSR